MRFNLGTNNLLPPRRHLARASSGAVTPRLLAVEMLLSEPEALDDDVLEVLPRHTRETSCGERVKCYEATRSLSLSSGVRSRTGRRAATRRPVRGPASLSGRRLRRRARPFLVGRRTPGRW
jgi:hypothetical protein